MNSSNDTKSPQLDRTLLKLTVEADYSSRAHGWAWSALVLHSTETIEPGPASTPPAPWAPTLAALSVGVDTRRGAEIIGAALIGRGRSPDRVVRTAAGGVAFYFFGSEVLPDGSHRKYACLESDEDGALTALYKEREGASEVFDIPDDISVGDAVKRVVELV